MKILSKFLLLVFLGVVMSCKTDRPKVELDYKYDKEAYLITCNDNDVMLYNEALYAFENDLLKFYGGKNNNIYFAYNNYFKNVIGKRVVYDEVVTPYTLEVLEALKAEEDLWLSKDSIGKLNYKANIFKCISGYFKNEDLKTTFNALVSTNSMTPELYGSAILPQINSVARDRYLTTYLAMEYYAKLIGIDPVAVKARVEAEANNVETDSLNTTNIEVKPELKDVKDVDPHAGHNH